MCAAPHPSCALPLLPGGSHNLSSPFLGTSVVSRYSLLNKYGTYRYYLWGQVQVFLRRISRSHLCSLSLPPNPRGKTQGCGWLFCGFSLEDLPLILSLPSRVAEVLEGKGAGKKGRFQGKATKMSRRAEVQALLQDYISTQSAEEWGLGAPPGCCRLEAPVTTEVRLLADRLVWLAVIVVPCMTHWCRVLQRAYAASICE